MPFSPIHPRTTAYVWPTGASASRPAGGAGGAAHGQGGQFEGYVVQLAIGTREGATTIG